MLNAKNIRVCATEKVEYLSCTQSGKTILSACFQVSTAPKICTISNITVSMLPAPKKKAPEMFLAYIGLMIPLYLDAIWEGMPAFITLFFLVGILAYAIIQNKKLAKESCFFKDIIDIIEMIEKDNR